MFEGVGDSYSALLLLNGDLCIHSGTSLISYTAGSLRVCTLVMWEWAPQWRSGGSYLVPDIT